MKAKKIFIIGSPGSGKTTLAKKLSSKLNIPHFDLDNIRYPKSGNKREDHQAAIELNKLISKPSWIIEGIYLSWTKEAIKKADLIIWLDISYQVALYRVVIRFLKNLLTGNLRHGFKSTLLLIKNLMRYHYPKPGTELNDEDQYITRQKTAHILKDFKDKVIHIKSDEDLNLQLFPLIVS